MTQETEPDTPRRGLDWGTRIGVLVACGLVVALAATLLVTTTGMLKADPGKPGWEPIVAASEHGTKHGESGDGYQFQMTQRVVNDADQTVTIESIRSVPPDGFTEVEVGTLEWPSLLELDIFGLTDLQPVPVELAPGADLTIVLRYDVECLTEPRLTDGEVRILLDVTMGSIRQEVEVPGVAPIETFEPTVDLPAC